VPSAWGETRHALSAVRNLETLLRSSSVRYRTLLDLLPELQASARVLSDAFDRARTEDAAAIEVGRYGAARTAELGRLLDDTAARGEPKVRESRGAVALEQEARGGLADRACTLADELEATADLLVLLERAAEPAATEVDVHLVVLEAARLSGSGWGRELVVSFDERYEEGTVYADPYVIGPLLSLTLALTLSHGVENIAVRVHCEADAAVFTVEEGGAKSPSSSRFAMRVLPAVPPTAIAAERVARQVGARLKLAERGGSLWVPRLAERSAASREVPGEVEGVSPSNERAAIPGEVEGVSPSDRPFE
jgi:hypothetical protein